LFSACYKKFKRQSEKTIREIISNSRKALLYLLKGSTYALPTPLDKIGIPSKIIMKHIDELRSDYLFYEDFFRKIEIAKKKEPKIGGGASLKLLEII